MLPCQIIVPRIASPCKGFVCLWTRNDGCSSVDILKPRSASQDPDSNTATAAKLQQRSLRVLRSSKESTLELISAKEQRNERHPSCCTLPLHLTSVIAHLILIWHKSEEKPLTAKHNKASTTGISCTIARITDQPHLGVLHRVRNQREKTFRASHRFIRV